MDLSDLQANHAGGSLFLHPPHCICLTTEVSLLEVGVEGKKTQIGQAEGDASWGLM